MGWLWGGKGERLRQVMGDTQGSPGFFRRRIPLLLWCCQGRRARLEAAPQPSLRQCPLSCSSDPFPALPLRCHNLPAGPLLPQPRRVLTDPAPHPLMLQETPACLIPHNHQLQARGRLSSRECDLAHEQHNPVTPSAPGSRPRAQPRWLSVPIPSPAGAPSVPGWGWGGLRTSPSTDWTGQGQHMLHARSPPISQGLTPSRNEMQLKCPRRGAESRGTHRTCTHTCRQG